MVRSVGLARWIPPRNGFDGSGSEIQVEERGSSLHGLHRHWNVTMSAGRDELGEVTALRRRDESLSPREHEVMTLVVKGWLNKQIAAELRTSEATIRLTVHNSCIRCKGSPAHI
jgi:regulatory LuxR family protein